MPEFSPVHDHAYRPSIHLAVQRLQAAHTTGARQTGHRNPGIDYGTATRTDLAGSKTSQRGRTTLRSTFTTATGNQRDTRGKTRPPASARKSQASEASRAKNPTKDCSLAETLPRQIAGKIRAGDTLIHGSQSRCQHWGWPLATATNNQPRATGNESHQGIPEEYQASCTGQPYLPPRGQERRSRRHTHHQFQPRGRWCHSAWLAAHSKEQRPSSAGCERSKGCLGQHALRSSTQANGRLHSHIVRQQGQLIQFPGVAFNSALLPIFHADQKSVSCGPSRPVVAPCNLRLARIFSLSASTGLPLQPRKPSLPRNLQATTGGSKRRKRYGVSI